MYCIRHIQNFGIFSTVFPGICWHIQSYLALSRHIHAYWVIINIHSGLFSTLCNSRIHNLAIFWALAYLELEVKLWNVDQAVKTLP